MNDLKKDIDVNKNSNSKELSNDLFFEKFNKSKKDFKKEIKKKKSSLNVGLLSQYKFKDLNKILENDSYLFKIYMILFSIFFITVGFAIAIFTIFLPYSSNVVYDSANYADIWKRVSYVQYPNFAITLVVFSSFIFILLPSPYLYLVATWFVGINQVKRSKFFVITNVFLSLLAILFFLIIFILSTMFFVAVSAPINQYPAEPLPTI